MSTYKCPGCDSEDGKDDGQGGCLYCNQPMPESKAHNLVSFSLAEVETDFRCPHCDSLMSSGINDPQGDYDDWMVQPHCVSCDFETISGKQPFGECLPGETPEPISYILFEYIRSLGDTAKPCSAVLLRRVSNLNKPCMPRGGTMYQEQKYTPVPGFVCEYRAGETINDFDRRAYQEAEAHAGLACDYCGGSGQCSDECTGDGRCLCGGRGCPSCG